MQLTVALEILNAQLCALRVYGFSGFSLELLQGGGRRVSSLTAVLAKWQFTSQQLFLEHQSRSDAKSIMLMLVPTAVCYFNL